MTARGLFTLLFGALMLVTAASVGSQGAFLLGAAALIALALSLLGVLCAALTLRAGQQLGAVRAVRGEQCVYTLSLRVITPVPIAPAQLSIALPSGRTAAFSLPLRMIGTTTSENRFPCPHVGVYTVGTTQIRIADCLGLFAVSRRAGATPPPLTVLPDPAATAPVRHSPGEGEATAAQRAQADRSTPEDTRAWQDGDEMKRIHWKLSMRRQTLMVHTYDTPQRPDALVLLDCSPPPAEGAARARMIDALTETCAGVLKTLLDAGHSARLPLEGDAHRELSGQTSEALAPMLHALAQETFSKQTDFARVLMSSSRRMRRTGSTAIITAQLTPQIADVIIALGRMGPHTSLMLITPGAPDERQEKLLYLLRASGVETATVRA